MDIKRIIRETIDDFDWIKNIPSILPISNEEGNNFILIADVIEDLPYKPQELMFQAGYRWAGDIPSVHGNPHKCKDAPIYNRPYVIIPEQGKVNYIGGFRKFGIAGWIERGSSDDYYKRYIQKWNPRVILWSDIVNKEPDYILDNDEH